MDRITWDQIGTRFYETGVDRGVLYLSDDSGVPWNGLTSVDENSSDTETESLYFDGVKYLTTRSSGDFSATIKAYTYPDEFGQFDGLSVAVDDLDVDENGHGLIFENQPVMKTFGLSYRTRVGNDLDGTDHGYKIHLAYNLTAKPDPRSYSTMSSRTMPMEFSWPISGIPQAVAGHKPTAHAILDSRKLDPKLLSGIEDILYGSSGGFFDDTLDGGTPTDSGPAEVDGGTPPISGPDVIDGGTPTSSPAGLGAPGPRLPSLTELVSILTSWVPPPA